MLVFRNTIQFITRMGRQLIPQWLVSVGVVRLIGWAIAGLALWGFYDIVESVWVSHSQWVDLRVLLALRPAAAATGTGPTTTGLDALLLRLAQGGEPMVLGWICAVAVANLVRLRQWIPASVVAIASLGALALNPLVQSLFPPPAAPLWQRLAYPVTSPFLLHPAMGLLVYGLVGYLLGWRFGRWRWAIALVTLTLILAVGGSRVALGVQGCINLLAGYTVLLPWLLAAVAALHLWREPTTVRDPLHRAPGKLPQADHVKP